MTVIEYKGYRIEVGPVGKGWRAAIFAPGSTRALADSPSNLEKSRTEEIVVEAKRVIAMRAGSVIVVVFCSDQVSIPPSFQKRDWIASPIAEALPPRPTDSPAITS
jgi:hypothetical protein